MNATTAGSLPTSVAIAADNTLEGLAGALIVQRLTGGTNPFDRVNEMLAFTLAAIASPVASATMGVAALVLGGVAPWSSSGGMWFTWWLGDMTGALTFAPLILLWSHPSHARWCPTKIAEAALLLAGATIIGIASFSNVLFNAGSHYPLMYLLLLPLLWAAVCFGPREAVSTAVYISAIAIAGTLGQKGPFTNGSLNASLIHLQAFMGVAVVTGLCLGAATRERRTAQETLEQQVLQRTQELRSAREQEYGHFQRLRATILHLPMAALLMDEKSVRELNEAYCQMFHIGMSPEEAKKDPNNELLRRFRESLLHPDEHMQKVQAAIARGEPALNQEILLKDGRVVLRDYIPIRAENKYHGQLFLYRDVTKERRIDRAKSEFMSLASHQLRTPLTAIRWSLRRLEKELSEVLEGSQVRLMAESQRAAARMSETINTMLKISGMETGNANLRIAELDLRSLTEESEQLLRAQYEAKGGLVDKIGW